MHSALKSGEETVESTFPKEATPPPAPPAPKALPPAPAAAEPEPFPDPNAYLAHLEEEMAVAGTGDTLQEVWQSHIETSDGRLSRGQQERAEGLFVKHAKRVAAKSKAPAGEQNVLV
jgi:hypothetical protein